MELHWKFLLYTKVAYHIRVCHDFDPRLFGQGHWKESAKFVSGPWLSYEETLEVLFTQGLLITCVMILTQGH